MKTKPLLLATAMLLAAGGWWLARTGWRAVEFHRSGADTGFKSPDGPPKPGHTLESPARLAPPDPARKFRELTPEERVRLARRGPVGG